jgi:hypothetical protein
MTQKQPSMTPRPVLRVISNAYVRSVAAWLPCFLTRCRSSRTSRSWNGNWMTTTPPSCTCRYKASSKPNSDMFITIAYISNNMYDKRHLDQM